ncbi:long-chain-fatty-acid--CoA ligase [Sphaerobacter thermophilus]|uniref:AMP-dependent synthetase and ligase n=1 Tax=Sphaerobacter thermophilus (strain ATCC 49802 / DSM 20745 / KCCM 41009 / NCIMB 13125 / S 6022) TaxID=479434 RepID=D1C9B6_SPHTD|nr:long-chain fatty acid--CoA ligase [Sphaerobacter thermophilus]ACZ40409.1 AMP-dependent synthetase and ligase [Sphaerobacter thermophilus DSM 20745]
MSERPWLAHYPPGVPATLEYPEVTLDQFIEQSVAKHADLTALRFATISMTYRELWGRVLRCAAALAELGIGKGDRVALMLPNCPQYVIAYFGTLRAGGIVVQVSPLSTPRELVHHLSTSGAETIVVADMLYPMVQAVLPQVNLRNVLVTRLRGEVTPGPEARAFEEVLMSTTGAPPDVQVTPDDVAVLQYTGGTTGIAKGAMLTHRNLVVNVLQSAAPNPDFPSGADLRVLTVLPLFHVYGMTVCMNLGLARGGELILLPRFEPAEVLETIKATQPTSFPGVPTMYVAINSVPNAEEYGVGSIRFCNSGGAPMPLEVMEAFEQRFGATIIEGYGLSETSPVTHVNPATGLRKPGTIGIPVPDTDAEIVDIDTGTRVLPPGEPGELRIRGPQVMAGYWGMPEETADAMRDGWFYTGDIATMDEDGYFTIVDRKKDMILASGLNVYPREVEEVLYEHPAVLEAGVIGVPDPYRGESVKAYVVLKPGASATAEELEAYCREHLSAYKVPHAFEFRDTLPKSGVGKVLRRVLVEEERQRTPEETATSE